MLPFTAAEEGAEINRERKRGVMTTTMTTKKTKRMKKRENKYL